MLLIIIFSQAQSLKDPWTWINALMSLTLRRSLATSTLLGFKFHPALRSTWKELAKMKLEGMFSFLWACSPVLWLKCTLFNCSCFDCKCYWLILTLRRWFDVLVMYPRSLTIKTKRGTGSKGVSPVLFCFVTQQLETQLSFARDLLLSWLSANHRDL